MSTNKPSTPEPVTSAAGRHDSSEHTDIEVGAPCLIAIGQIECYDHNPRHADNPEYGRIKASIREDGMEQPLVITQRPGETHYRVYAGGNTRLRVVKELHAETGDERFARVPCVFRAWTRDTDVLLAHLKENELRGDLTFLDKALAVDHAKRMIEAERRETLSQRRFGEILKGRGYALSQTSISRMVYAVERLHPVLPDALGAGLGRQQVNDLRALDNAMRDLWSARDIHSEAEYEEVFATLCRRYDGPDFDIALLRRALEAEVAERAEVSIHAVNIDLDERLAGRARGKDLAPWGSYNPPEDADQEWTDHPADRVDTVAQNPSTAPTVDEPRSSPSTLSTNSQSGSPGAVDVLTDAANHPEDAGPAIEAPASAAVSTDLKSLRARAWTLASRLAQRNGLGDLIEPLAGQGLGFLVRDVPDPALAEQLDENALAQVSMVWWHLAASAEMTVAPLRFLLPTLDKNAVLYRALEDSDAGLLFSSIWTLDPGNMGFRLWRRLDDRDWEDLLALMATYRALYRTAEASGQELWEDRA